MCVHIINLENKIFFFFMEDGLTTFSLVIEVLLGDKDGSTPNRD